MKSDIHKERIRKKQDKTRRRIQNVIRSILDLLNMTLRRYWKVYQFDEKTLPNIFSGKYKNRNEKKEGSKKR